MDLKKIVPWNWFKDEESSGAGNTPVVNVSGEANPLMEFNREIDRVFENFWSRMRFPLSSMPGAMVPSMNEVVMRPNLEISSSDGAYSIIVEVPGVKEDEVKLELSENRLVIQGEKTREESSNENNIYRSERMYGAFRRVLTLPDDADPDHIEATFQEGLLKISIPRKAVQKRSGRLIDIKTAA